MRIFLSSVIVLFCFHNPFKFFVFCCNFVSTFSFLCVFFSFIFCLFVCFCFSAILFSSSKSLSVTSFEAFKSIHQFIFVNIFFYPSILQILGRNCFSCQHLWKLFLMSTHSPKHFERSFDFQLVFSLAC